MCQSKADGGRRCITHDPGSRLALSLSRRTVPDADEPTRLAALSTLHAEARTAGLTQVQAAPSEVEAWLDHTHVALAGADMQHTYRDYCARRLDQVEVEYRRDPSRIDAGRLHTWRHLESVIAADAARQVRERPARVAFDLDGCVYSFDVLRHWMTARGYAVPDTPQDRYSMPAYLGISQEQFFAEMRASVQAGLLFRRGEAYPDGLAAVRAIYQSGHQVVILTARNLPGAEAPCHQATVQWLRETGVPFDELVITHRKEQVDFDVLIDDHPGNVEQVTAAGKRAVLLDRPWNRLEGHPGHERVRYRDVIGEWCVPERGTVLF